MRPTVGQENLVTSPFLAPTFPDALPDNPMHWAEAWLNEATDRALQRNPNSMTLGTVSRHGHPTARVVLCKHYSAEPGFLVFYTNYNSRKVAEIRAMPEVSLTMHWDALGRQVRIEGSAVFSPASESDAYFASRDPGSQIGAWGSDQSSRLESRQALIEQIRERAKALGIELSDDLRPVDRDQATAIPRPPHWGGLRVWPRSIELWIEGPNRVHDRGRWTRTLQPAGDDSFLPGPWAGTRLQP